MNFRISGLAVAALLAFLPAAASAQQVPAPSLYDRAIAAGYKAAMLCSGIFNAEMVGTTRTQASVEANELKGIYPEYNALIADLPATIETRRVLVRYDAGMPARIAVSAAWVGCTTLPIGTPEKEGDWEFIVRTSSAKPQGWPADDSGPMRPGASTLAPVLNAGLLGSAYGNGSNTTAIVVVRDGKLIGERYAAGFGQ